MPSIAIVIATYNGAATLDAALDSIAEQSVPPNQLIIIDGGSSDDTQTILARRSDMITHWQSAPDVNLSDAWNKALPHVTAEWVWFIGCDDRLAGPQVIQRWRAHLRDAGTPDIAYGRVAMITSSGRIAETIGRPWRQIRRKMLYYMSIPHTGMLVRNELFKTVGAFDIRYALAGDYDWTRRALRHCEPKFFDDLLVYMNDAGLSGASRTQLRLVEEFGAIASGYGPRPAGWYWLWAKALVKARIGALWGLDTLRYLVDLYRILTLRTPRLAAR